MLFRLTNNGHAPLIMRVVEKGDGYGRNNVKVHEDADPLIEFYDARYPDLSFVNAASGQFISRYYLSSLKESLREGRLNNGLDLYSGFADWHVSAKTMRHHVVPILTTVFTY